MRSTIVTFALLSRRTTAGITAGFAAAVTAVGLYDLAVALAVLAMIVAVSGCLECKKTSHCKVKGLNNCGANASSSSPSCTIGGGCAVAIIAWGHDLLNHKE